MPEGADVAVPRGFMREERLVHSRAGQIDTSTEDDVILMGPIPDREEAMESVNRSLTECVNAELGPRPPCPGSAVAAGSRSCSFPADLPKAHAFRPATAPDGTAPSVLT